MNSPSSAVAVRRSGSVEPRLFTPPLRELTEDTSWGYECIHFLERVLKWKLLPWQRWLYIHALEKNISGDNFRFQTLVVLIARQNGKTMWLKGLGLWRMYLDDASQVIISAQNLEFAENTLAEAVADVKRCPPLRKEFVRFSRTNGKFKMELTNDRAWRASVSNRKGGRSLSVDLVMMDELREHQNWLAWNALSATTTARPRSMVVAASNAGDSTSVVLRSLRDGCIDKITLGDTADTQTGLFEWSAPDDVDHLDPDYWPLANPALGHLFNEDVLKGKAESMGQDIPGFRTEHLALDVDTEILTSSGWTTLGRIRVGDRVYHPDGHPVDVTAVTPVYHDRDCYCITTTDGRRLVADADHRWLVSDRRHHRRGWEILSTHELVTRGLHRNKTGGRYAYQLPTSHAIISKPVDLPMDPYLLGVWLGDGTTGKNEITCINSEADELISLLPAEVISTRTVGNARRIRFRTVEGFPATCRKLGIWHDKHIPDAYLTAGTEQRLALLQGLLDTDGSIDDNGRIRFCSTRQKMAGQVIYLARSLGWRPTITEGASIFNGTVHGTAYCVAWTHDASEPSPFRLQRKLARICTRPSRAGERTTVSIRSITPVTSRPVRCITVGSEDHLWLAGRDLVPTHNCQWVATLDPSIFPAEDWAATTDPDSRRADREPVWAGVDVNFERSRSYIGVAARRDDGLLHTEIAHAARGTDWITEWFAERVDKFQAVVIQARGAPASSLIEDLHEAGVPVIELGGTDLTKAYSVFYDGITTRTIYHRPSPALDAAAESAQPRTLGDAWVVDRKNSPVDASPLVAVIQAAAGAFLFKDENVEPWAVMM